MNRRRNVGSALAETGEAEREQENGYRHVIKLDDEKPSGARRATAFFSHLVSLLGYAPDVYCVAVAHMVPNTVVFVPGALDKMMHVSAVLAKPKSVERSEYAEIAAQYSTPPLSREWAADAAAVVAELKSLAGC